MNILVLNCGSSSLKYQLIDSESDNVLASGLCERIGIDGMFTYKPGDGEKSVTEVSIPDHKVGVGLILDAIVNKDMGVISGLDQIGAIGHRVVHGGERFASSVEINDEVMAAIEECNDLAPLHNPANLIGIRACQAIMPGVPNVAVFDTAFHQTMPKEAYLYGLPIEYYDRYKIRRYGFHGTSHSFVSKRACEFLGLDRDNSRVIVCHLGNGSSISAVLNGKSVDTSMGLTPLEGVIMGTRSGSIDPAIIEFIAHKEDKCIDEVMNVLNKKSGVLGLSGGVSSDFRDLDKASKEGNELAKQAVDVFCYSVIRYIGAYVAVMNGVDAIVFTAGLGENNIAVRKQIIDHLGYLGITLDEEKNNIRGEEVIVSTPDSRTKVAVIPTNEELAIARETVDILSE